MGQKADQKWGRYMTLIFAKRFRYCAVACVHCRLAVAQHRWRRQDFKNVAAAWSWWAESRGLPGANLEASVRVKRWGGS